MENLKLYWKRHNITSISQLILPLVLFAVFLLHSIDSLDPDFGWHLRLGEIIVEKGVSYTDPFSYTMPSFPFIDHEWLTNLIIAKLYHSIGYELLTILFILIALLALIIQLLYFRNKFSILILILAGGALLNFVGLRPQVISWFLTSILALIFFDKALWNRGKYLLPIIIALWVNLHGSFAFGIGIISIYFITLFLTAKRVSLSDFLILLASYAASGINPYGYRIWDEVWMQFSDSSLRFSIVEWLPSIFFINTPMWLYFVISITFVFRYFRKFHPPFLAVYIILSLLALSSIRHMPLWMIFSFPATIQSLIFFSLESGHIKGGQNRLDKAFLGLILVSIVFFILNAFLVFDLSSWKAKLSYPENAAKYLKRNPPEGNIFAVYNWGGYLIWKLPEKKVFVDGRMPSWRWKSPYPSQSNCAFCEYQDVISANTPFSKIQKKYKITTVLLPSLDSKSQDTFTSKLISEIENKLILFLNIKEENRSDLYKQMKKNGMEIVYKDKTVVVYQTKNP